MHLRELFEDTGKTAVAAFGRMNPPTIGHAKLVDKLKSIDGDHYLFLSQTQKPKDNPLDFATKLSFAKKFFPGVNVGHEKVRTPIQMLQMLEQLGYTDVIYVAGSDRVDQFEKLFNDYNGKEYNFNSIQVVSAGDRDPDAEGAEGMSASKMRAAAKQGDFESFKQGVPDQSSAEQMYDAVRKGMGIQEPVEEQSLSEYDITSSKSHKKVDSYRHYDIYVSKQKFKDKYFIASAVHKRTNKEMIKAQGKNPEEAVKNLIDDIEKMFADKPVASGPAIIDFNAAFAKNILALSGETFYAKLINGPKLVIAGSEMLEYPEIMKEEGFKKSSIRNVKDSEGATRLPAIAYSANQIAGIDIKANARYLIGNETSDKDGNRVFDLTYDSDVYDKGHKVMLRQPALTVGTQRQESIEEETATGYISGLSTRVLMGYLKKLMQGDQGPYEKKYIQKIQQELQSRKKQDAFASQLATESDLVLNRTSLIEYLKDQILNYIEQEDDIDKLSQMLLDITGKKVKSRGDKKYTITSEDTKLAVAEACKHGMYYCSTDKKMKCRQGPKQSRG